MRLPALPLAAAAAGMVVLWLRRRSAADRSRTRIRAARVAQRDRQLRLWHGTDPGPGTDPPPWSGREAPPSRGADDEAS